MQKKIPNLDNNNNNNNNKKEFCFVCCDVFILTF